MSSLLQNLKLFKGFLFSISISRDSASYFLGVIMLISFVGTQIRTAMGVGSVTFPNKRPMIDQCVKIPKVSTGPMRVKYSFLTAKSESVL